MQKSQCSFQWEKVGCTKKMINGVQAFRKKIYNIYKLIK